MIEFLYHCYLALKVAIMSRLEPKCKFCHRPADDWSGIFPLCEWHYTEIRRVHRELAGI